MLYVCTFLAYLKCVWKIVGSLCLCQLWTNFKVCSRNKLFTVRIFNRLRSCKALSVFSPNKVAKKILLIMILLCLNLRDMSFTSATPCNYCIRMRL